MTVSGQRGRSLLGDMRHQARDGVLLWALALLLFAQALIPIQSHTRWAVADDGRVVELCTLHGTLARPADGDLSPAGQDDGRSPAMAFSHLLASAITAQPVIQPAWLTLVSRESPPAAIVLPAQRPLRLAPIRAPPALV